MNDFDEIVSIEEIEYEGDVYNLHIQDNHNYFANGINVANCHGYKSASLIKIMEKLSNARYRIGTTGSLDNKKCFAGDTLVDTIEGPIPIRDISPGDMIKSLNFNTMAVEYRPALRVINNGHPAKMLKIKTSKGIIEVTPDHKIMTSNGWTEAKYLKKGSKIISIS